MYQNDRDANRTRLEPPHRTELDRHQIGPVGTGNKQKKQPESGLRACEQDHALAVGTTDLVGVIVVAIGAATAIGTVIVVVTSTSTATAIVSMTASRRTSESLARARG